MDASVIQSLLRAEPFRPFRVTMSRAASYVISSPADALLTRSTLYVAKSPAGVDGIAPSAASVPLAQIVSAEPV